MKTCEIAWIKNGQSTAHNAVAVCEVRRTRGDNVTEWLPCCHEHRDRFYSMSLERHGWEIRWLPSEVSS